MTDLEGLVNLLLDRKTTPSLIKARLVEEIKTYKETSLEEAGRLAEAVLAEVERSRRKPKHKALRRLLEYPQAGVKMGEMGVGSRGEGDLYVHSLIAQLATVEGLTPLLGPLSLDDAGAVYREQEKVVVTVAVDGTHSRLSSFPFIAGFHVTRACLRDVYVKGARPVALFDDLHLADDGDVGKLFDFVAGVSTVSGLTGVPLVSGSTLRVGGDMVLGDRMVSCVGAVGLAESPKALTAKRNIRPGDIVLMTEGAGGGTVATAAIYSGNFPVLLETLNINFLEVCRFLLDSGLVSQIHAMTDVTNGGIRGDANTICREAGVGMVVDGQAFEELVNPAVLRMMRSLSIDPLGVSLDSLLIFAPKDHAEHLKAAVTGLGIKIGEVGRVVDGPLEAQISYGGELKELKPKFRESPYTEVKRVVGEEAQTDKEKLKTQVAEACRRAKDKRDYFTRMIKERKKRG